MASAPPRGGWEVETHGLAAHLRDAIRLNRARRPGYVRLGGWRAGVASSLLIASERALLPSARLLDRQARPFVEAGIPILVADLTPMPASGLGTTVDSSPPSRPPPAGGRGLTVGGDGRPRGGALSASSLRLGAVRRAVKANR
ncbi:MAG: hypothetical protein AAF845_17040, partial [Bacteroidota bacterium]